jgi:UDP-4-amino-4,6-dideoxy-N-acetyl-beta-L-altrosamine transaminase
MLPIPYGRQWIDQDDIAAVIEVLKSDWITQGPKVEEFEKALADYIGVKYAVTFNSGTSALHAAMFATGVSRGDEVITSPITFVATPNSALYLGGKPVFVDIDLSTYCIDTEKIEPAISKDTKVIAPVDMAGYPVDLHKISKIAHQHDLVVIEDAAHALGAKRDGKMVGQEADMTMFSFHPVKHITTGEGGAIVTNNEEYFEKLTLFRNHGITKDPAKMERNDGPWYYEMHELGYNFRLTDIQCALGLSQLKKLDSFIKRRNEIAAVYDEAFADSSEIRIPPKPTLQDSTHAYHLYPILLNSMDRQHVYGELKKSQIFSQVHYIPIHLQPYYRKNFGFKNGDYPLSEMYYQNVISLPIFPKLTEEEISYVIQTLKRLINGM